MKKLIVAAAVAMLGIVANANAVKWSVSLVNPVAGSSSASGYTAYFFMSGDTSGTFSPLAKLSDVTTALGKKDLTVLDGATSSAVASGVTSAGLANFATTTLSETVDVKNTLTGFLIVVDDKEANYLVADVSGSPYAEKYLGSGTGAYTLAFGSQKNNTGWVAMAPEPTSGLLLLIGMAGLALKRKRT